MKRSTPLAVWVVVILAGLTAPALAGDVPATGFPRTVPAPSAPGSMLFAGGLQDPAAFTFAPDGRVFYGERASGQIRIISADGSSNSLFFTVPDVTSNGEQGLLGIALHPDYPSTPQVFAYATRSVAGHDRNYIVRVTDNAGTGEAMEVIWSSPTDSGSYHDGGHIAFGPDGKLYAVVGEGHSPDRAQHLANDAGKVLRMNADGTAPNDNPFGHKLIWTYGLRNSFGFDFDPVTGRLWESENGPECNDEINRIRRGRNYGWGPNETCSHPPADPRNTNRDGRRPVQPLWWWTPTIAPTGAAFCDGCGLGRGTEGRLFLGSWDDARILRVRLDSDRRTVAAVTNFYDNSGGVMSVEAAPDGRIFFSDPTSIRELTG